MRNNITSFLLCVGTAILAGLFVVAASVPAPAQTGLRFDGKDDYVTFGPDTLCLGLKTFTLELWFYREGPGIAASTGFEGVTAVPLLARGRSEDDGDSLDVNYFLGIRATDDVLVADYVEGDGQASPGFNHPVIGVTPVRDGTWYHGAVSFDGHTLELYLNGNLEAQVTGLSGRLPCWEGMQHAALASALTSDTTAFGFFQGILDEVRIWDRARSQQAISDSMGLELASAPGLISRWGLDDGTGTTAGNSAAGCASGILANGPTWVDGSPFTLSNSLKLGSSKAYVTFGNPPELGLSRFTIETWFRRDGPGTTVNTGNNGVQAVPLVTKGARETEGDTCDINYFMGISGADDLLCADFEDIITGRNYGVFGKTPISTGRWYHAAAAYDGSSWRLYLDGMLEIELVLERSPEWQSIQHAALGTALTSTGEAFGSFNGVMDEVRIWNYARSRTQIQSTLNEQITTPRPGLVARWSLNEGSGDIVNGSAGSSVTGTIMGSGWSWVDGAPFDIEIDNPPYTPDLFAPWDGAGGVSLPPALEVMVMDVEFDSLTVTFYGRPAVTSSRPPFTLIHLSDAQYYTSEMYGGTAAVFLAQAQWIVDNISTRNITYAHQIGDITENGDSCYIEWERAWAAMSLLEDPAATGLPEGLPYGVSVGNHDQTPKGDADGTTNYYNEFFGIDHFAGRSYYGGNFGSNNDNHYQFFSAGGLDFIAISLEFDIYPDTEVLNWADSLLKAYPLRKGIACVHNLIREGNPGPFNSEGMIIYNALRDNQNLCLMLCGHAGIGRRTDTNDGITIHTIMSDYTVLGKGGKGYLRIMTFHPDENIIVVKTYSPTLGQYLADPDSIHQFTLQCDLQPPGEWVAIGEMAGVPTGSVCSMNWPGLGFLTGYEWYVEVSDGISTTRSPTWSFTTRSAPPVARVVYPNGGEEFTADEDVNLQWTAYDDVGVTSVDLILSHRGASGAYRVIAMGLENTGDYAWTVQGLQTEEAFLKIIAHDADGNVTADESDSAFAIMIPTDAGENPTSVTKLAFEMLSPNPVCSNALFGISLPYHTRVRLAVYDVSGRRVAMVVDEVYQPGRYQVTWDGRTIRGKAASGAYFARLEACGRKITRKIILVR